MSRYEWSRQFRIVWSGRDTVIRVKRDVVYYNGFTIPKGAELPACICAFGDLYHNTMVFYDGRVRGVPDSAVEEVG